MNEADIKYKVHFCSYQKNGLEIPRSCSFKYILKMHTVCSLFASSRNDVYTNTQSKFQLCSFVKADIQVTTGNINKICRKKPNEQKITLWTLYKLLKMNL